jgi:hypothetical protein
VTGLAGAEVNAIIGLTNVFEAHVQSQIATEQNRLLPIVRSLPLEDVLGRGQKAFVVDSRTKIADRRKK